MGKRYLNTSEKATMLAEGVWLAAQLMDKPPKKWANMPQHEAWLKWCEKASTNMIDKALEIQKSLFDIAQQLPD